MCVMLWSCDSQSRNQRGGGEQMEERLAQKVSGPASSAVVVAQRKCATALRFKDADINA